MTTVEKVAVLLLAVAQLTQACLLVWVIRVQYLASPRRPGVASQAVSA